MIKYICIICLYGMSTMFLSCKKDSVSTPAISSERYKDKVFTATTKTTIQYDSQLDYAGNSTALYADFYQPIGDVAINRAAIIFVHGGGFVEGTRDGSNIPYFCEELAKRGYVVASIDYRLGVADASATAKGKAQIRAIQDLKSFIRYSKKNAATAKIDITKLFITGSSAGGATILATAYMDFGEQPSFLNPTSAADLEGYGNVNGNNASVKAAYSLWGAVGDTSWINTGDVPVGCIQSINDPCIPWDYNASSCNVPGFGSYGSHAIYTRARNLGMYTSLYGFQSDVHDFGFDLANIETTISEISNFLYPLAK